MTIAVAIAIYALVGLVVGCRVDTLVAWHWLANYNKSWDRYGIGASRYVKAVPTTTDHWAGAGTLGAVCGAIWPVVVVAAALRGVLFAPPRDVQIKRQQDRIAELEKELEIHG